MNCIERLVSVFRWVVSLLLLLFGLYTLDRDSWKWALVTLIVYSCPLVCQFFRPVWIRVTSIWLGIALALQTIMSFHFCDPYVEGTHFLKETFLFDGKVQTMSTDSHGYRTTKPIDYGKRVPYRVFAVGGSTTANQYLGDQSVWTHHLQLGLEQRLKLPVEVVNTGVQGLLAAHHFATLKRVLKFHPKLVIFMMGGNDWALDIRTHFHFKGDSDIQSSAIVLMAMDTYSSNRS